MGTNDFAAVGAVLAPEFVLEWPLSRERIRGAERFARMNAEYPAHGRWSFTVNRLVGGQSEAVSDVTVTDGVQTARVISFFEVSGDKITRLVEFWPEPYEPPANRRISWSACNDPRCSRSEPPPSFVVRSTRCEARPAGPLSSGVTQQGLADATVPV